MNTGLTCADDDDLHLGVSATHNLGKITTIQSIEAEGRCLRVAHGE
jgi:hypothetical protein